ncbi:uncharacterized protein LOC116563593 isoform X2 [Sapajus apella]|uniref:Uncharacterized protein LOC116563593 isoform X2 n=1 Tax=Sapajus apella TaxID=9515 RepID=A0A6J3JB58_SAPAP|nr:uncharacterized protein LOC116563593 isoform X2 [Sapajus apella]
MGISTRRGRGLASITANLPWPPCWEETTRHAAAKRLQRRKRRRRRRRRRRWRCLPRAAAAPGGWGRRAVREERPEPQRYGGPAGPPAFACRAVWGVAGVLWRRAQHFGLLSAAGLRDQGSPYSAPLLLPGEQDSWLLCTGFSNFLMEVQSFAFEGSQEHPHRRFSAALGLRLQRSTLKFPSPVCGTALQDCALRLPQGGFSFGKNCLSLPSRKHPNLRKEKLK